MTEIHLQIGALPGVSAAIPPAPKVQGLRSDADDQDPAARRSTSEAESFQPASSTTAGLVEEMFRMSLTGAEPAPPEATRARVEDLADLVDRRRLRNELVEALTQHEPPAEGRVLAAQRARDLREVSAEQAYRETLRDAPGGALL